MASYREIVGSEHRRFPFEADHAHAIFRKGLQNFDFNFTQNWVSVA